MTRSTQRPLLALNGALLLALAAISFWPDAARSSQPSQRARGEYTMVAGKTNSGSAQAVYVIDSVNQELIGLSWDRGRATLSPSGYRSLDSDSRQEPGR